MGFKFTILPSSPPLELIYLKINQVPIKIYCNKYQLIRLNEMFFGKIIFYSKNKSYCSNTLVMFPRLPFCSLTPPQALALNANFYPSKLYFHFQGILNILSRFIMKLSSNIYISSIYKYLQNLIFISVNNMNTSSLSQKDFEYVKELGSGSFGTVQLVKKIQDDKYYAIKSVQLAQMAQKQKDAALNQVRLLASINIPYVIGYHGAFFDNNKQSLCIVMQYADGGDLQGKITDLKDTTEQGFEETFVWKVAYEILSGLKILHKNKIIHRDIKSANIFFSNGIAKLGDLNVSKVAEQGMCTTQTGTPYYTSPQIWKGQKYTSKCDIWSTGCLLYQICTLTHPFKGRDFPSLYRKVIVGNYEQIPSKYSQELQDLIRMCLTVDDQMRPSASQLLQTTVLSGMEANMDKFDSKGEVNLIDAIKCPRVLKFLNTKLPKRFQRGDTKKKTVNFEAKKEIQKTQSHGFKIHKQQNLRKIRSQKIICSLGEDTSGETMSKATSKKNIRLPPIEIEQSPLEIPVLINNNSEITSSNSSIIKTPLSFSQKKLKTNSSIKRIASRKFIVLDETKNTSSGIQKNETTMCKVNNRSRVLLATSTKKIPSSKMINIGDKENKKLIL